MRRGLLGIALTAAALLCFPTVAQAAFPGRNGPIIVTHTDTSLGGQSVDAVAGDGSVRVLLSDQQYAYSGRVSPDGGKLVYVRWFTPGVGRKSEIWAMNLDGSDNHQVSNLPGQAGQPTWSPDGRKIAFSYWSTSDSGLPPGRDPIQIMIMDADGTHVHPLTWGGRNDTPAFSPDGRTIAYTAWPRNAAEGLPRVFLMNAADGTGKRKLTIHPSQNPNWSPDGRWLAFEVLGTEATGDNGSSWIGVARADGTSYHKVQASGEGPQTSFGALHQSPAFSPDGSRIAYSFNNGSTFGQLWTMHPDGSDARPLAQGAIDDWSDPDWAPIDKSN